MTAKSSEEDVPFYLMPVAALLGLYTFVAVVRTIYLLFFQKKKASDKRLTTTTTTAETSNHTSALPLVVSGLVTGIAYSFVVAKIERAFTAAEYALFDPYEILNIGTNANSTVIKKAYRELAKIHHPDKQSSSNDSGKFFVQLSKAYDALAGDEASMRNYQLYGHPDGPLSTPAFQMALPTWLLFPEGKIAGVMLLMYLGMIAGLIYYVVKSLSSAAAAEAEAQKKKKDSASNLLLNQASHSVSIDDLSYLANHLKPDSSHMDVLMAVISTPANIAWSLQDLERVDEIKRERASSSAKKKNDKQKSSSKGDTTDFDELFNDDDGWDQDDDPDDAVAERAAKAEAERQAELEQLRQATGKAVVLLEGVDDGVLGQAWVERTLEKAGVWPPPECGSSPVLDTQTFDYKDQTGLTALQHPGLRRILCMTVGRLNSNMLNSHPELLEAGSKKRIDQTYFKASMEFRQRATVFLEAALRVAMILKNERLLGTTVETLAMFKIGIQHNALPLFNRIMTRTYGTLPRLKIKTQSVSTPEEKEIATGDKSEIQLDLERSHAELFLKQKVEMFKKQGIPPQVGLQAYREGWWLILRHKRVDGKTVGDEVAIAEDMPVLQAMAVDPENMAVFENEDPEHMFVTAWPMMIQNCAQKGGKVKVQFRAPSVPGKYKYILAIKSQDFLGADQELEFDVTVVDSASVKRKPKKDEEENTDEAKKDK